MASNNYPAPKCILCQGSGIVKHGNTTRRCPRCGGKGIQGPVTK